MWEPLATFLRWCGLLPPDEPPAAIAETIPVPDLPLSRVLRRASLSQPPTVLSPVARSINGFGLQLYRHLPRDENLLISPAGIVIALGMVLPGARGRTKAELQDKLRIPADQDEWHAQMGGLARGWSALGPASSPASRCAQVSLASCAFGDRQVSFLSDYSELLERDYRAPLVMLNFRNSSSECRESINRWVEEQTRERIKHLIPDGAVTDETRLVLVNAVYFWARWETPFPRSATNGRSFWVNGTVETQVPTMCRQGPIAHAGIPEDEVSLVLLPYDECPFSMVLVVPDERDGLARVEGLLDEHTVARWLNHLDGGEEIVLQLPKFRIDPPSALELSDLLKRMGLESAFGAEADLSGMADPEEMLQIDEVFHKGFIEVNEEFTEAAAATAVLAAPSGAPAVAAPPIVAVNRPFLFMLVDMQSGAIAFVGRVSDPLGRAR